ncbi:MAG: RsiV family protein [Segniliparus sp.]|uniref:RsiV family protein n=1 Tax=Segniliparus sp. TaxID=2804064 RepID=UPI003F2B340A
MRLLVCALLAAGAFGGLAAAPASADQAGVCAAAGGTWREHGQYPRQTQEPRCEFQENLSADRAISYSSPVPEDLLGDAWAESQLAAFIKGRVSALRSSISSAPQSLASADIFEHQKHQHSASVQSLVFHELADLGGAHPNDAYLTMTFDLAEHRRLAIGDVFKAGTNLQSAITPLVLRYAPKNARLDQLSIGNGYNTGTYTTFALTPTELVVYLPEERVGPVNAGAFTTHIPLAAFGDTLRPEYR